MHGDTKLKMCKQSLKLVKYGTNTLRLKFNRTDIKKLKIFIHIIIKFHLLKSFNNIFNSNSSTYFFQR